MIPTINEIISAFAEDLCTVASSFCYTVAARMNEPECANPQLLQFLKEWWDVAKERSSKGATV